MKPNSSYNKEALDDCGENKFPHYLEETSGRIRLSVDGHPDTLCRGESWAESGREEGGLVNRKWDINGYDM